MTIVTIADVSVGYGCPQIQAILRYLMKKWGAKGVVLEPDQPQRPPIREVFQDITVTRMMTYDKPFGTQWNIEYVLMCAKEINIARPEVIVVVDALGLPVLEKLQYKPKYVIYYCLEMPEFYPSFLGVNLYLHKNITQYVDLVIFAEENRRQRFIKSNNTNVLSAVVYNCVDDDLHKEDNQCCNGRVLYQGTIDERLTFAEYYTNPESQNFPIDLFGLIEGKNKALLSNRLYNLNKNVRYMGYVSSKMLTAIRSAYAYGIVSWNPVQDNFLYAAPNKFFEYIQDGVVPIAAPHPQCKHLIEKYDCGILMKDWSYDAFVQTLSYAMEIYDTPQYEKLKNNCKVAHKRELNWNAQMEKLDKLLPSFL